MDDGWGAALLDALRHYLQHHPQIAIIFTGTQTFAELGPEWTSRFISARRIRVSFLRPEESISLLTKPIPEFGVTYMPGALDAILTATAGQPFLIQAVAFELVQVLNEQHAREATIKEVEEAIARALVSGGEYFANIWNDAGEHGWKVLRSLANGDASPYPSDALRRLKEKDVLSLEGTFAVPMIERWVRENRR
jgi:hypothetical protein